MSEVKLQFDPVGPVCGELGMVGWGRGYSVGGLAQDGIIRRADENLLPRCDK